MDKQLVGYRGKIHERTYMPPKPRKYGVFGLCEATAGFALKDIIYSGKDSDSGPHISLANDIVMKFLCSVFFW